MDDENLLADFKQHLATHGASREHLNAFIIKKRDEKVDMRRLIKVMVDYAWSVSDEELMSETVLLIDAEGVMGKLSEVTGELYGEAVRETVFGGEKMPEVGWTLGEMNDYAARVERRYLSAAAREDYERACEKVAHCFDGWNPEGNEVFLKLKSVDAFCEKLCDDFIGWLEHCRDTGELLFNQKVDDSVIAFMRERRHIRREGDKIIAEKIPFQTIKYLNETDPAVKRHYACHCPWVRELILRGESAASFCNCSLGLEKKDFETAFGRELDGRVIETVQTDGVYRCVFEIDIPEDILAEYP